MLISDILTIEQMCLCHIDYPLHKTDSNYMSPISQKVTYHRYVLWLRSLQLLLWPRLQSCSFMFMGVLQHILCSHRQVAVTAIYLMRLYTTSKYTPPDILITSTYQLRTYLDTYGYLLVEPKTALNYLWLTNNQLKTF